MPPEVGDAARDELRQLREEAMATDPAAGGEPGREVAVTGVVRRLEVEGGVWVLEVEVVDGVSGVAGVGAADGGRLQLLGEVDPGWAGLSVVVTGVLRPDLMTTAQVGPVLVVARVEAAGS